MRDDGDFAAYAAARWPSLVRSLVLLGVPPEQAPEVGVGALARLRGDWRHRDELGDLDEHAYRTLLDTLRAPREATTPDARLVPLDPDWPDLSNRLDRLAPGQRAALVLPVTAGLVDDQVVSLVGEPPPREPELADEVRRVADSVPVPPLAFEDVVARQRADRRARRRRAARRWGLAALVLLVVAGGWSWWATRPGPPADLPDVEVERLDNPVGVGWYTDDTLRLDQVALRIDDLQSFSRVPRGAVYADSSGGIVLVDTDGHRTRLGRQAPDGVFAASTADGLVAWVDERGDPELRLYDLAADEVVATTSVAEGTRVVAIDDGVVYVTGPDGAFAFESDGASWQALARVGADGLLDVAGYAAAFQADPRTVDVVHLQSSLGVSVRGTGAQLAPDGAHVLTRRGGPAGSVSIFDAFTGKAIDTGLAPRAEVYAAKLSGTRLATYLVELAQDDPVDGPRLSNSGSLQLVTCPVRGTGEASTCTVHLTFPKSTSWALEQ